MKNKILLSFCASALMLSSLSANNSITEMDLLKQDLKNVKTELELLKKNIKTNEEIGTELFNSLTSSHEELIDMEERIDDVEASALTDKISIGADIRQEMNTGTIKFTDGTEYSGNVAFNSRLRLNLFSQINEDMQFYGRLSMAKNWGNGAILYDATQMDHTEGRVPNTSALFVERAYITYDIFKDSLIPVEIMVGRIPSNDGPSIQFKDNTVRKAMVSAFAFDAASDGAQIGFDTEKLLSLPNSSIRLAYARFIQNNMYFDSMYTGVKNTNVYGAFFSTNLSKDSDSNFNAAVFQASDIMNNMGESAGDVLLGYSFLEFPNLYNSGLSLFAQVGMSSTMPSGENNYGFGLLGATAGNTQTKTGHAAWIGTRYKLDLPSLKNPRIGAEYNYGSENWVNFTSGSAEIFNKMAVRGSIFDVYYTQPLNNNAFVRLSYQYVDKEFSGEATSLFSPTGANGAYGPEVNSIDRFNISFNVKF